MLDVKQKNSALKAEIERMRKDHDAQLHTSVEGFENQLRAHRQAILLDVGRETRSTVAAFLNLVQEKQYGVLTEVSRELAGINEHAVRDD